MPTTPHFRPLQAGLLAATLVAPAWCAAQVTMKPDGQWRSLFTLGTSVAAGNTEASSYTLGGDGVRLTDIDKISLSARAAYAKNNGEKTTDRIDANALYTRDLTPRYFGFGQLDAMRDEPSNIASRLTLTGGAGIHVLRGGDNTFDLSAGIGFTRDTFDQPNLDDGTPRSSDSHADLLLAEESTHRFTETTSFKQKLSIYPNLKDRSDYRAVFDAGLSVAMSPRFSLTATLSQRYDSSPSSGLKRNDTLFVTGVSVRFD